MTWVIDASVILKWILRNPDQEADTDKATAVLERVVNGTASILQPVHWLAEVTAVLSRISPSTVVSDVEKLQGMEFPVADDQAVLTRAAQLSIETGQHVFDTLYHAVAIEYESALLITADDRYRMRAKRYGHILALSDWQTSF